MPTKPTKAAARRTESGDDKIARLVAENDRLERAVAAAKRRPAASATTTTTAPPAIRNDPPKADTADAEKAARGEWSAMSDAERGRWSGEASYVRVRVAELSGRLSTARSGSITRFTREQLAAHASAATNAKEPGHEA